MTDTKRMVRVRTGCITCRKRRIKCDEGRPSCDRCRNANFGCEGYNGPQTVQSGGHSRTKALQNPRKAQDVPSAASSSPRSDALSLEMVEELPWRQTNWRREQLPLYHHFVTSTVKRLFPAEHLSFWRDRVAQMSFGADGVYEALLAVGAAHRAALLVGSGSDVQELRRLQVHGLRAYGNAIRFLATDIQAQKECFMDSPKAALRHLYAAIQVFRRFKSQSAPLESTKLEPISGVISRFDFLAMKLLPYASSSFCRYPTLTIGEKSLCHQPDGLSLEPSLGGQRLLATSSTITSERHSLIQLVSSHNKLTRVVWGPWYPTNERPSRDELLGFHSDMLTWKDTSPKTVASCISDLDLMRASTIEEVGLLPIPPQPLGFTSAEAAVNMIMYNGFLGCALAALSTTDPDPLAREIESFNSVYQTLRISSALLSEWSRHGTDEYGYRPCDSLDMGISMFLYYSARRCFSPTWQQWIVTALHSIGREGLLNAHSFANTLEIMAPLERVIPPSTVTISSIVETTSPLGRLKDRLVPVVLPRGEKGEYVAYFLRYGATNNDNDENFIRVVGLASWRQNDVGHMVELETKATVFDVASQHELGNLNTIETWREKVEIGWHGLI